VSIVMAKAEGWYGKNGSKWKTMPELMLKYRAATLYVRLYAPELTMGMHTADELEDVVGSVTLGQQVVGKTTKMLEEAAGGVVTASAGPTRLVIPPEPVEAPQAPVLAQEQPKEQPATVVVGDPTVNEAKKRMKKAVAEPATTPVAPETPVLAQPTPTEMLGLIGACSADTQTRWKKLLGYAPEKAWDTIPDTMLRSAYGWALTPVQDTLL
jgi:hypothetical protein